MQGYGQAPMQNQQLAEMLAQQQMTQQRQQAAQGLMDNNGHAGLAGILGAALGGWQNKKKGDMLASGNADIEKQIAAMQAESEAQIKAAKEAQQEKKWSREDMIRAEKSKQAQETMLAQQAHAIAMQQGSQGFQAGQNDLNRQSTNNRFEQSHGLNLQQLELQKQNAQNKGGGMSPLEKKLKPLVESGQMPIEEAQKIMLDDARGVKTTKELSGEQRQKAGFLKNARDKLAQYKKEAFHDGDYQEFGSKFGNTNNLLKEAVRNKLRAESGAAISDQELESELALFSPGMFRSDETNLSKIEEFEKTLETFENQIRGGQSQKPKIKQQPLTIEDMNATLMKY